MNTYTNYLIRLKDLLKYNIHADHEHKFAWGGDITSALEFAKQAITACIVNNHARYVIGNQRRL